MSFIHPLLLGGIVLIGLPVVLHLIMRQQPKHLLFPAFRFLKLQLRTNQRKLRLRHLLLLILRMLLILLMCLALAQPRFFSDRFGGLGADQAAAVVIVIDTSPSMDYVVAGKTRLDEAKTRALELLDELGPSSRVGVIDSGDVGGDWAASLAIARERIAALEIRAGNRPVTDAYDAALALFGRSEGDEPAVPATEALPRFVFVFSDRTPASWENSRLADLKQRRERLPDPKPKSVYIDVGVEQPVDLAIADIELRSQVVAANQPVVLNVTVQATGQECNNEITCRFDNDPLKDDRKPVKLAAGGRQIVTFERRDLSEGFHQAEVFLGTDDSLRIDNIRFATIEVRKPQKVLIICDRTADADLWRKAVNNQGLYQCDVKSNRESSEVAKLVPSDLAAYRAVCLISYNPAQFGREIWEKLEGYVIKGGGLAVALGGPETDPDDYNYEIAQRLLPGSLVKFESSEKGVELTDFLAQHQLLAPHREEYARLAPNAQQFWEVKRAEDASVLIRYKDAEKSPALLERVVAQSKGRGKVLLFTTPMDGRKDSAGNSANDFNNEWFYFVLVNETVRYLAGETESADLNHLAGAPILVPLPLDRRYPNYTLQGPRISGSDSLVTRAENANELRLTRPKAVGAYTLSGGGREWQTQFSVNIPPDECNLLPRIAAESITDLFGADSLVAVGQNRKLRDALEGQLRQPVDLLPWLMMLLLLALAVENFLANRFYRPAPASEPSEKRS